MEEVVGAEEAEGEGLWRRRGGQFSAHRKGSASRNAEVPFAFQLVVERVVGHIELPPWCSRGAGREQKRERRR